MAQLELLYVVVGSAFSLGLLLYTLANATRLSSPVNPRRTLDAGSIIDAHEFGLLEERLPDLEQVCIVCHTIEMPTDSLLTAVERNFQRGVRYCFYVPESRRSEITGYYQLFEAMAKVASAKTGKPTSEMIQIQSFAGEWRDCPYVFYYQRPDKQQGRVVLAIRGLQRLEGIAETYEVLPRGIAYTLIEAIRADAPTDIDTAMPPMNSDEPASNEANPIAGRIGRVTA